MKITVDQIWPGMRLKEHEHKGRVVDVVSRGFTQWAEERVEILFPTGEPVVMLVGQTVETIDE
jgi:hypothetical protein